MIRKLIGFFVVMAFGLSVSAQHFEGGVIGGIVGSQVDGDRFSGYHKAGVYGGFWVRLALDEKSSIQTELVYFQKGSRHNPNEQKNDFTSYIMRLGYIEMPFLYRYNLSETFVLEVGPSFGYLMHNKEWLNYETIDYGAFQSFNFAGTLGVSLHITENISVALRDSRSIISIRKTKENGAVSGLFDKGQYSDALQILLSYRF